MCKSGYNPDKSTFVTSASMFTACKKENAVIANCNYTSASNSTTDYCVQCNDNYAMAYGVYTACAAFSGNKHCTEKDSSGNGCYTCQSSYYFDGTNCIKRSLFVGASLMLLGLLISIFN